MVFVNEKAVGAEHREEKYGMFAEQRAVFDVSLKSFQRVLTGKKIETILCMQ